MGVEGLGVGVLGVRGLGLGVWGLGLGLGVGGWGLGPLRYIGYYGMRSTTGQYATYWNVFLFNKIFAEKPSPLLDPPMVPVQ